jgi:hypothetical protein
MLVVTRHFCAIPEQQRGAAHHSSTNLDQSSSSSKHGPKKEHNKEDLKQEEGSDRLCVQVPLLLSRESGAVQNVSALFNR